MKLIRYIIATPFILICQLILGIAMVLNFITEKMVYFIQKLIGE